jgi:hypothetical protein
MLGLLAEAVLKRGAAVADAAEAAEG